MAQLKITSEIAAAFMTARKMSSFARKQEKKRLFGAIRRAHPALPRNAKIKIFVENSDNPLWCVLRDKRTGQAFDDGQEATAPVASTPAELKAAAEAEVSDLQSKLALAQAKLEQVAPQLPAEVIVDLQDEPATSADTQAPASDFDAPTASDDELAAAAFAPAKVKKVSKPKAPTSTKTQTAAAKKVATKAAPAKAPAKPAKAPKVEVKASAPTATKTKLPAKAAKGVKNTVVNEPGYPKDVRISKDGKRIRLGTAHSAAEEAALRAAA
jgi:hypothetical protein